MHRVGSRLVQERKDALAGQEQTLGKDLLSLLGRRA